jgi:hypothetical protein
MYEDKKTKSLVELQRLQTQTPRTGNHTFVLKTVSTHPSREPPQGIEKFEAISLSPRLVPSYPLNVACWWWLC